MKKYKNLIKAFFILFVGVHFVGLHAATLSFSARLVNADGSPVAGPVDLRFELAYSGDTSIIQCTKDVTDVGLSSGVFHTNLNFEAADCGTKELAKVLQDTPVTQSLMMQVSDRTDSANIKTYPFQALNSVPISVMSEVSKTLVQMGAADGEVLKWNGTQWAPASDDGEPGTVTEIQAGSGLTANGASGGSITGSGIIAVASGGIDAGMLADNAVTSDKIVDGAIQNVDIADGVIAYAKLNIGDGQIPVAKVSGLGSAAYANIGLGSGNVASIDSIPGCAADEKIQITPLPTYPRSWSCVDDSTATDNSKLPLAGGTMSGTINMNGYAVENVQAPLLDGDAATKKYVDDGLANKADSTQLGDYVAKAGDSMTGALQLDAQNELRLADSDSTNYVALRSNATVGTNFILTLPSSAGSANQVLTTDGTGVLTWSTPSSTATPEGSAGGELAGTYPNPTIANAVIDDANVMTGANISATKLGTGVVDNTEFNTLDGVTSSIQTQLDAKEVSVTAGTSAQYRRGDKTWQTLDTSVVPENGPLYFTNLRAQGAVVTQAITDGVTATSPSEDAVFDALALKANTTDLDSYVLKAGDTMTGALNLPANGLDVGAGQLVATGGNVGVGVSAPSEKLVVAGNMTAWGKIEADYNGTQDAFHAHQEGTGNIASFSQGATWDQKMVVTSDGNVGIGTSTPSELLVVGDDIGNLTASSNTLVVGDSSNPARLYLAEDSSNFASLFWDNTNNVLSFDTKEAGVYSSQTLTLKSGNVGVGTSSPGAKLEVAGQVKISGGAPAAGRVLSSDASGLASWVDLPSSSTPSGAAGGELSGSYPNPTVADGVIDNANVVTGANLDASKLGTGVVDNTEFNYLDGVTSSIQTQLNAKEGTIAAGTTSQYWRGDKSWQTLNTSVVPEGTNLYYTATRARTDAVDDAIVDAVTDVAPSQNAVFDALALKADANSLSNYVLKAGDTMTGALNLPLNAFKIGTNQLVATGGNVGIGTASPSYPLEVSGSGQNINVHRSANTNNYGVSYSMSLNDSLGNKFRYATVSGSIFDNTDGAEKGFLSFQVADGSGVWGSSYEQEKLRVLHNGDVGIGTATPAEKLEVKGNIQMNSYSLGSGNGIFFRDGFNSTTDTYNLSITTDNPSGDGTPDALSINAREAVSISTGANTQQRRMIIDSAGKVGIGTQSPFARLNIATPTIASGVNVRQTNGSSNGDLVDTTGRTGDVYLDHIVSATYTASSPTAIGRAVTFKVDGAPDVSNANLTSGDPLAFWVQNDNSSFGGNVGIGTTSPQSALNIVDSTTSGAMGLTIEADSGVFGSPRVGLLDLSLGSSTAAPVWYMDNSNDNFRIFRQPNSTTAGTNMLNIDTSGNVGIGTSAPLGDGRDLTIGNASGSQGKVHLYGSTSNAYSSLHTTNGNLHLDAGFGTGATGSGIYLNWYGGGVTNIGNGSSGYGEIKAANFTTASDRRLKRDIFTLDNSLENVLELRGVGYYFSGENYTQKKQVGLIAQEVRKIFPEMVSEDKDGFLSVSYSKLVAPLIEATKQQQSQIESNREMLKAMQGEVVENGREIASLVKQVKVLKDKNESLEQTVKVMQEALCEVTPEKSFCP